MDISRDSSPFRLFSSWFMGREQPRAPSAFTRLNGDIIFEIMMHNIDMDNDPPVANVHFRPHFAMNVLRSASQVNQEWRSVALNSTFLWSRVLNLNLITELKHSNWYDEVLFRIGDSKFDVKCEFTDDMYPDMALAILVHLKRSWGLIRKLDIGTLDIGKLRTSTNYSPKHLEFLALPANALQSVNIRLENVPGTGDILGFRLFNDFAPLLKEFHCSNVKIHLNAPWMLKLRSLHIDDCQSGPLSIRQLCTILSNAPQLESLEIRQRVIPLDTANSQTSPFPMARLPRLQNLVIDNGGDLTACWEVAEFIKPHAGCCLVFKPATIRPNGDISLRANILHKYLNGYNLHRRPSFLKIMASPTALKINDHPLPEWSRKWQGQYVFNVDIPFHPHMVQTAAGFFKMVYNCDYSSIVHLDLDLSAALVQPDPGVPDPSFAQFIRSFESVEVLTTTAETIELLCRDAYKHILTGPIFPRLRTLRMFELKLDPKANFFFGFLAKQWNSGNPVEVFEFTLDGGTPNPYNDLRFLDLFSGMIVKWRHGRVRERYLHEYVCGSGRPKKLLITGNKSA